MPSRRLIVKLIGTLPSLASAPIRALAQGARRLMEIILHVGAHRTGTTSFQRAMTQGRGALMRSGTVFWGPQVTRSGRFSGLLRGPGAESGETARLVERNRAVIRMEAVRLATAGTGRLIVSEENTLGSVGTNLRTGLLYPGLPERLARFAHAFDGVARIGIGIRRYQDYWASALAFAVPGGARLPDEGGLDRLVTQPRTWRRVISDIAAAFPGAEIAVWDFDELAGRPDRMFTILTGGCGHLPAGPALGPRAQGRRRPGDGGGPRG